jgi:hypothetical protein
MSVVIQVVYQCWALHRGAMQSGWSSPLTHSRRILRCRGFSMLSNAYGLIRAGHARRPRTTRHTSPARQTMQIAFCVQAGPVMLVPHSCLARVLCDWRVRMLAAYKGHFLYLSRLVYIPKVYLSRLTGVWRWLGMLTQGGRWLILVLKSDLTS